MILLILSLLLSDSVHTPCVEVVTYRQCFYTNQQPAPEFLAERVTYDNCKVTSRQSWRYPSVLCGRSENIYHYPQMTLTTGVDCQYPKLSESYYTSTVDSVDAQGRTTQRVTIATGEIGNPAVRWVNIAYTLTTVKVEVKGVGSAVCYLNGKGQVSTLRLTDTAGNLTKWQLSYDGRGNLSSMLRINAQGVGDRKTLWQYRYNEYGD